VGSDCHASVFGIHVAVCVSARVKPFPVRLLLSQPDEEFSFSGFISTNKQTNKSVFNKNSTLKQTRGSLSARQHPGKENYKKPTTQEKGL